MSKAASVPLYKRLKVDGKPLSLESIKPARDKIQSTLDELPDDELLKATQVEVAAGVGRVAVYEFANDPTRCAYYQAYGPRQIFRFGNKRAIVAFRQWLKEQGQL